MRRKALRPVFVLSTIIAVLAAAASAGGFLLEGLYRDNEFVTSLWGGNDLVTLFVAVPMLIAAMILASQGSYRALLLWMAMLNYTLYNFAFYLFAAAFNWFFLIYVALFTLSAIALIFGLVAIDPGKISRCFRPRTPVKWISSYLLLVAIGLTSIYVIQSLQFAVNGTLPEVVTKSGHPTSVIFAVDLSLLVPVFAIGAIWLWKRRPWGYVLASISMVKGTTSTLVLAVVALWGTNAGVPGAAAEIPIWSLLTVVGLIGVISLLGNLKGDMRESSSLP